MLICLIRHISYADADISRLYFDVILRHATFRDADYYAATFRHATIIAAFATPPSPRVDDVMRHAIIYATIIFADFSSLPFRHAY